MDFQLTQEQKERIRHSLKPFKEADEGGGWEEARKKRARYFQRLGEVDEAELEKILTMLWATRMWTNKRYLMDKIISKSGLDAVLKELTELLHGSSPPAQRYEGCVKRRFGLGPAAITEILCHAFPKECGIWCDPAREALEKLGFADQVPVNKYQLSADEYARFNEVARAIAAELRAAGLGQADLLLVNDFLWIAASKAPAPEPPREWDHDEVRDKIGGIGAWLGFEAETEVGVGAGAKLDVVWEVKIARLGVVKCCFEVQKHGSIHSLILKLRRALNDRTVQRVVAVSDPERLADIKRQTEDLPEVSQALVLWPVWEVFRAHDHLREVSETMARLGLLREAS